MTFLNKKSKNNENNAHSSLVTFGTVAGLSFLVLSGIFIAALSLSSLALPDQKQPFEAFATFPGENGKIAFSSDRDGRSEIYVMNPDGSGQTRMTDNPASDIRPSWSPDGEKIAFSSDRDGRSDIYVMNAEDGSDVTRLTDNPEVDDTAPSWSPDGEKIAFSSSRDGRFEIYVMNADGSDQTRMTDNRGIFPNWSPDGTKIAFSSGGQIFVMDAEDGSDVTRLTVGGLANWSPDGEKIAFMTGRDGNLEIYVMNADGSDQTRMTDNPATDTWPSWSPDGEKIAFESNRDGNREIYVMNSDGTGQTNLSNNPQIRDIQPDWGTAAPTEEELPPEDEEEHEGLGQGFWRNNAENFDAVAWEPTGYSPDDKFGSSDVFDRIITVNQGRSGTVEDPTLLEALGSTGGGINVLARQGTAALLNAAHPDINYPFEEDQVKEMVQQAIDNPEQRSDIVEQLEAANELGGGVDQHGNPV